MIATINYLGQNLVKNCRLKYIHVSSLWMLLDNLRIRSPQICARSLLCFVPELNVVQQNRVSASLVIIILWLYEVPVEYKMCQ